ncbi:RICIN domain-containing protein [Planosporangium sp. 12N6]|uniref:RICIN domain-containing protein n=1 Tax=Planosporangium spinosum TaxID=3402278 RepID=UPI003CEAF071
MTAVPHRRAGRLAGRVRPADDTGSLAAALLLALVGITLTALLVPVVVNQFGATRTAARRLGALNAAQAGLDAAVGHIRAANDGPDVGRFSDLPCGELSGPAGPGGTAAYRVTVSYLDPAEKPVPCGDRSTAYARLRATGTDGSSTRTLNATYTFRTSNENIPGGLIHVFKTGTVDLCMDAGSATPKPDDVLRMQVCRPGSVQQKFAYNTNLTLVLVASKTAANPLGMCLDAGPHAVGNVVRFQKCADPTSSRQQWSINDSANFEGANDQRKLDGFCFNVQSPNTPTSLVVLTKKCRGGYDNVQTFSPDASVGAGAAGAVSGQLMNYRQFGRCLDVTETDVDSAYLIAWPCKQAPNLDDVLWNQKWALPGGNGRITTTHPSKGRYCLQSPATAGGYVRLVSCPNSSAPARTTWTVRRGTDSYASSYRIEVGSGTGVCLSVTDPAATPPDFYQPDKFYQVSKVVTAPCDSSTLQKWNADPNDLQSGPLTELSEE